MEHLSRRTSGKVDMLFLVTDYSLRGLRAVRRIHEMLPGLHLEVDKLGLVVTRGPQQLNDVFRREVEEIGIPLAGIIPDDQALLNFDMEKRSLIELPDDSPSVEAVNRLIADNCAF
jgi:CO dehydrogenase maturation factor